VTREGFGLDRGDGGRYLEGLGGFSEADDVVLQGLAVDGLDAEGHLRLLIDEDKLAVLGCEDFKISGHWSFSLVMRP